MRKHEAWLLPPRAAYIHIPFCRRKCSYCDFISFAGLSGEHRDAYVEALLIEIAGVAAWIKKNDLSGHPLSSVYIGGGTPTMLSARQLTRMMDALKHAFGLAEDGEFTFEANPGTVSQDYLKQCRAAGFNRISFGLQAVQGHLLQRLGRIHRAEDFASAVQWAKEAGFLSISADIMFGLPKQSIGDVDETLNYILELPLQHISYYGLILEPGTPLADYCEKHPDMIPDESLEREQYHLIRSKLARHNFTAYEISSSALPGHRCRHNLVYWQALPYYGFGIAAHSYIAGSRRGNTENLNDYLNAFSPAVMIEQQENNQGNSARQHNQQLNADPFPTAPIIEHVDHATAMNEMMLLGLRLIDGVSRKEFYSRFGQDMMAIYAHDLQILQNQKLIMLDDKRVCLTEKGLDLANQVFQYFV